MNGNSVMFFVPGKAVPQGSKTAFISKSTGKPIVVDKDVRLPQWRATVTSHALARLKTLSHPDQMPFAIPLVGPAAVSITVRHGAPEAPLRDGKNAGIVKASAPSTRRPCPTSTS